MSGTRHSSTHFEVSLPPDGVAAYLTNPRNLVRSNREGEIVERSDGPLAEGSWYVLAFGPLRTRIEYAAVDLPRRIVVTVQTTNATSSGVRSTQEWVLAPLPNGRGTRVEINSEGSGGCLPGVLRRGARRDYVQHLRAAIEASGR